MSPMDEQRLAADIEAMAHDPEAWGDAIPTRARKSEKRQRGVVVSVRLTPEELEAIQGHATAVGETVSGYLRQVGLRAAAAPLITTSATLTSASASVHTLVSETVSSIRLFA